MVRRHGGKPHRSGRRRRGKASQRRVRPGRSCVPRTRAPAPRAGGAPQQVARVARAVQDGPGAGAASRARARGRARARARVRRRRAAGRGAPGPFPASRALPPGSRRGRPAPAPHLQRAQAAPDLPAPAHPRAGAAAGRRIGGLVSDRLLPAAAIRPRQRVGRGDRHRAAGSERQRRCRSAHQERRGLERDALRVAPQAGRQDRRHPAGPLRPGAQHELWHGDRSSDQLRRKDQRDDPRGGGPHPDRRDHQGPRAERRLPGREQELQGLRPEQVRRPEPEVPRGIPLPGHLPARSGVERRSVRLGPAAGLPAEHRRREHVVREVEEPHGL